VSTLEQMGLLASRVAAVPETCVGLPGLATLARGRMALEFELADEVVSSVGTCRTEGETQVCALAISLVDMITWHAVTKHLELRTTRAVATVHTTRTNMCWRSLSLTCAWDCGACSPPGSTSSRS